MYNPGSDTNLNTVGAHKFADRAFLQTHGEVASKDGYRAGTKCQRSVLPKFTQQYAFYTSLNYNGN